MAIKQILDQSGTSTLSGRIKRIRYLPYKMDIALAYLLQVGLNFVPKDPSKIEFNTELNGFTLKGSDLDHYRNLIMYFHGDEKFNGDLNKGLLITGPTGTGKSLSMSIMREYRKVDNIKFLYDGIAIDLDYEIVNGYMINSSFMNNGFEALNDYINRGVLYIDDFGLETREVQYYGSKCDAVEYILSERHRLGKLTMASSNLPGSELHKIYGDRLYSRFKEMFNIITLLGNDKRK